MKSIKIYKSQTGNLYYGVMRTWYVKGYSDNPNEQAWFETKQQAEKFAKEQQTYLNWLEAA